MKQIRRLLKASLILPLFMGVFMACDDSWDSHYNQEETLITNDQVEFVTIPSEEYLQSEDSLSMMYQFLKSTVFSAL
jgi:hypothetical protein